jgi:hypothetical protein
MTLSTNWKFCSAPGAFMPIGCCFGLPSCALNIAASPKTAARPDPTGIAAPCSQPPTGIRRVSAAKTHAVRGISEMKLAGSHQTCARRC